MKVQVQQKIHFPKNLSTQQTQRRKNIFILNSHTIASMIRMQARITEEIERFMRLMLNKEALITMVLQRMNTKKTAQLVQGYSKTSPRPTTTAAFTRTEGTGRLKLVHSLDTTSSKTIYEQWLPSLPEINRHNHITSNHIRPTHIPLECIQPRYTAI
ncbi:unnamed protein product [Lymnaea stagnalis]|uniref:Uncharacterized protein n=1 Tax=Lymnaea stagnalis TaxID=6523 RepID=A0AAV2H823_LYMST